LYRGGGADLLLPLLPFSRRVDWFYEGLGIDDGYFKLTSPQEVADHVEVRCGFPVSHFSSLLLVFLHLLFCTSASLSTAPRFRLTRRIKITSKSSSRRSPRCVFCLFLLEIIRTATDSPLYASFDSQNSAVYIFTSPPGVSLSNGPQYERRIDEKYIDVSTPTNAWRLESYRAAAPSDPAAAEEAIDSNGLPIENVAAQLRSYFVSKCDFVSTTLSQEEITKSGVSIREVSDKTFLEKATGNTLEIYQELMDEALRRMGPVVAAYDVESSRERRIVIAYKSGGTRTYFSALSDLYHSYGFYSTRSAFTLPPFSSFERMS
jgi:hypothetical protein